MPHTRPVVLKLALVASLAVFAQGCALNGDFGRPKPSTFKLAQVYQDVTDYVMDGGEPSYFRLTSDETRMRETAYRLRTKVHSPLPANMIPYNESGYANHLTATGRVYGPSRLATIDDEITGDQEALTIFSQSTRLVVVADRRRLMALAKGAPSYSQGDFDNAINRVEENYAFIEGTFEDLNNRVVAYRIAVDRAKIETPAINAVSLESALNHLHERSLALRYELAEYHRVSMQQFGPVAVLPPPPEGPPPPMMPYPSMKPAATQPPPPGPGMLSKPMRLKPPWTAKTAAVTAR
jgi:hypothetical protein